MSSNGYITQAEVTVTSAERGGMQLGTLVQTPDGRKFRYARAGASNLAAGKLVVAATQVADHTDLSVAAAAIGDTQVTVTLGSTGVTADQYANGFLIVNDGTAEGTIYTIASHPAADASATVVVNLSQPLAAALAASGTSQVSLVKNTYADVVISATDQADLAVGVPPVAVTAGYYFFCATGGDAAVLGDEAVTAGLAVTIGTGVAGAVEALDAAGEQQLGIAKQALVDTEYQTVFLTLD